VYKNKRLGKPGRDDRDNPHLFRLSINICFQFRRRFLASSTIKPPIKKKKKLLLNIFPYARLRLLLPDGEAWLPFFYDLIIQSRDCNCRL